MTCLFIKDKNREEIDMSSIGLSGMDLVVPSPTYSSEIERIEGANGQIVLQRTLDPRNLVAEFFYEPVDWEVIEETRDRLFEVLSNGDHFFIGSNKVPSKQWKVHADNWTPDLFSGELATFEVTLIASEGTAESINRVEKTYNTSEFRFKNEGNVLIDPRIHSETEIEFKGVSTNLTILNLSTGDEWLWIGSTLVDDVITLKGVRSLKNGTSIFGQTNKKLLTFLPGNNEIQISGANGDFEISIRTRFYFL